MTTELRERDYSADERKEMAKSGKAMSDGSFPIQDLTDLHNAIADIGRATDEEAARKHIIKRAHELGHSDVIPYEWSHDGSVYHTTESFRESEELLEAAPKTDAADGKHIVEVTIIRAGTSKNGNSYPSEVLREATPLFEGVRAFADHPKDGDLPERSVRDLVGHYRNVRFEPDGRMRGELHIVPGNDWLYHLLCESQAYPGLCGVSIEAHGDRDRTRTVRRIHQVNSVDIVTRPAAGGSVDRIIASDRSSTDPSPTTFRGPERSSGDPLSIARGSVPVPSHRPIPTAKENSVTEPTTPTQVAESAQPNTTADAQPQTPPPGDLASLVEAQHAELRRAREELARVQAILNPGSSSTASDPTAHVTALVEEIKRERDIANAQAALNMRLMEARLPEPVERKLRKQFGGRLFEASELETAIADEKETLAALTSAGQIHGLGFEKSITVGMSEYDQLQAAFDGLFDVHESEAAKSVPPLSGIREAFAVATGIDIASIGGADRPLKEAFREGLRARVARGNLSESEAILREADTTTASFSYLLGTSMNKRLLKDYQAWPSEWQKFTSVVALKDFKQQDRIRLGAFGSLSTVPEDGAYTTLTLSDVRAIYTPTKRGNLVQVTRETIINDDLHSIKQIPQKLAVAAAFTLAEFVYNLLAPNFGNIYDAHPLFDSVNHLNTGVTSGNLNTANSGAALSSAALQTAVIKMRKQTNMAGKPIGLKPRYLLVPPDLEFTAMTILKSAGLPGGNNNDINPMMGYAEPVVSPQLNALSSGPASTTIWIAVADPRVIDTLEVGFVGGQANPVLLIQDMPLYGLNFTQDVISYKVRHEYGGAVVDYRGFYLGNN